MLTTLTYANYPPHSQMRQQPGERMAVLKVVLEAYVLVVLEALTLVASGTGEDAWEVAVEQVSVFFQALEMVVF